MGHVGKEPGLCGPCSPFKFTALIYLGFGDLKVSFLKEQYHDKSKGHSNGSKNIGIDEGPWILYLRGPCFPQIKPYIEDGLKVYGY